MGSDSASSQIKVTLRDCAVDVEFIGCGYSDPFNFIEINFGGTRRMAQQNDSGPEVMDVHDRPV